MIYVFFYVSFLLFNKKKLIFPISLLSLNKLTAANSKQFSTPLSRFPVLSRFFSLAPVVVISSVPPFTYFESTSTTQHIRTRKAFLLQLMTWWQGSSFLFLSQQFCFLKDRCCMRVWICLFGRQLFVLQQGFCLLFVCFLIQARCSNVNFLILFAVN